MEIVDESASDDPVGKITMKENAMNNAINFNGNLPQAFVIVPGMSYAVNNIASTIEMKNERGILPLEWFQSNLPTTALIRLTPAAELSSFRILNPWSSPVCVT